MVNASVRVAPWFIASTTAASFVKAYAPLATSNVSVPAVPTLDDVPELTIPPVIANIRVPASAPYPAKDPVVPTSVVEDDRATSVTLPLNELETSQDAH